MNRVKQLEEAIIAIQELIEALPPGIDYEADVNDDSPEDMTLWIGGLIWQICKKAMEIKPDGN